MLGNKHSLGFHPTEETRKKLSEAGKKRKHSKQSIKKMRLAKLGNKSRTGIPHKESTKEKMSLNNRMARKVDQFTLEGTFIKTWKSITVAGKETNTCISSINNCCLNKPSRKTAGGFIWKYNIEKNENA